MHLPCHRSLPFARVRLISYSSAVELGRPDHEPSYVMEGVAEVPSCTCGDHSFDDSSADSLTVGVIDPAEQMNSPSFVNELVSNDNLMPIYGEISKKLF